MAILKILKLNWLPILAILAVLLNVYQLRQDRISRLKDLIQMQDRILTAVKNDNELREKQKEATLRFRLTAGDLRNEMEDPNHQCFTPDDANRVLRLWDSPGQ